MSHQVELGIVAVAAGVLAGVLLFVPFVAISFRRRGRLTFARFALWFSLLVYILAVWTYTLLPLPDPDQLRCSGTQLNPLAFTEDITGAIARGHPLSDPALLQLILNVLLFLPLGLFVRLLWHRGILVAFVSGAFLSLFIELTQLTGVWGLYPCAYRVFDVVDLETNTLGAVLGSVLALLIPLKFRARPDQTVDANAPHPVTVRRRLIGMLCDLLVVVLTSIAARIGTTAIAFYGFGQQDAGESWWVTATSLGAPFVLTLGYTLVAGRTIGHAAVQLRYTGSRQPALIARTVRFIAGIGGYQILQALPEPAPALAAPAFVIASIVLVFTTKDHRGLPGLASGQSLVDSRSAQPPKS